MNPERLTNLDERLAQGAKETVDEITVIQNKLINKETLTKDQVCVVLGCLDAVKRTMANILEDQS